MIKDQRELPRFLTNDDIKYILDKAKEDIDLNPYFEEMVKYVVNHIYDQWRSLSVNVDRDGVDLAMGMKDFSIIEWYRFFTWEDLANEVFSDEIDETVKSMEECIKYLKTRKE